MIPEKTSQKAPLERFLARQRCNRVFPYVKDKFVLDFGCGTNAWNAIAIQQACQKVDGVDRSLEKSTTLEGIHLYQDLAMVQGSIYDVILALAVFEHIKPLQLREILASFHNLTHSQSVIVGTVPSRRSRRILEFLSYNLNLIDRSQIEDHKVYYDDLWMREIIEDTGWELSQFQSFQFGMNCFFALRKSG